jgi:serine/threonine protein kinase
MKKMRHKHIVTLYECIDDPEADSVYLVMQYISGGPIAKLDDDGECAPTPLTTVAAVTKQLVSALHYMHRRGVVHGDIKPDNILVSNGDADGPQAYLSDFGVARAFTFSPGVDGAVAGLGACICGTSMHLPPAALVERLDTQAFANDTFGCASDDDGSEPQSEPESPKAMLSPASCRVAPVGLGTPAFLAPEMFAGSRPTFATDMWALGVTLYVLIFGRLPFGGDSYFAVKRSVCEDAVAFPPSSVAARKWQRVIAAMLVKDPARRITAAQLRRCRLLVDDEHAAQREADASWMTPQPRELVPRPPASGSFGSLCSHRRSTDTGDGISRRSTDTGDGISRRNTDTGDGISPNNSSLYNFSQTGGVSPLSSSLHLSPDSNVSSLRRTRSDSLVNVTAADRLSAISIRRKSVRHSGGSAGQSAAASAAGSPKVGSPNGSSAFGTKW